MVRFLRDNAMGVSSIGSAFLTALFASHSFGLSPQQTALWVGLPSVVGNALANMKFRNGKNGNGNGTTPH